MGVRKNRMEETRGITVKVRESLHGRAKQEAEAKEQTMSQFIEAVLDFYFNREDVKEMSGNKRTLAFQVSEEFFAEVQEFIKAHKMKLKDFGIEAMRRMIREAPASEPAEEPVATDSTEAETPAEPE
jgi:hypothetical protein